jgi:hypothetical protein
MLSATTVLVLDAALEFFAIAGAVGVVGVVAAGAVRAGSLTSRGEAAADSMTVVCGAG